MRLLPFLLLISVQVSLSGCDQSIESDCQAVAESVYVNQRFPDQAERFDPTAARVFTFESTFNDTITIQAGPDMLAKAFVMTQTSGFAGQLSLKVPSNEELVIRTPSGCAHFKLKNGYKYLYINRQDITNWSVQYSNFSRGYF